MTEAVPPKPKRGGGKPGRETQLTKVTKDIKWQTLIALDMVGGAKYLARQAEKNPSAFLALLGKILPTQINANVTDFTYTIQKLVIDATPAPGVISTGLPTTEPLRLVANEDAKQ